ncbi:AAA family ATPase [Sphingomonas faeni]|uniref:AAA family ATPase n=1 Tax=Sphingomonas faeni TaxID=185950 RepID=UPI002782C95A|nr:AAA family ATPase [Sphingomonas faeni]MDQ0839198.1 exonuclease SbcC [Sphingomonas faeni]
MRVLAIRGRNLASLAGDFEVDFEAPPLADAGIFAITGPTGAGKSTLLDAMCLALFDAVPRLGAASRGRIETDQGDELSATDPRTILRHGEGEGFAEIDFVGRDARRYRARWSVQRARQKAGAKMQKSSHALSRIDADERLGGTKTETLVAIQDLIGLSADQFRRAVLLAQGDFEAFIKANDNDRAVLLERLTGSRIYTDLGRAAYEKAAGLRLIQQGLSDRLQAQNGLDEVARADAEARRDAAIAQERLAAAALASLELDAKWEADRHTLTTRLGACETEVERTATAFAQAGPARDALRRLKLAFALAPDWTSVVAAKRTVEEDRSEVVRRAADAGEAVLAVEAAEEEARLSNVASAALAERATILKPLIDEARTTDRRLAETTAALAELAEQRAARAAGLKDCRTVENDAFAALRSAIAARGVHGEWLAANAAVGWIETREDDLARHLAEHATVALGLERLEADRIAAQRELETADAESEKTRLSLADAVAGHAADQAALAAAEAAVPPDQMRIALMARRDAITAVEPLLVDWRSKVVRTSDIEGTLERLRSDRSAAVVELQGLLAARAAAAAALPAIRVRLEEARIAGAFAEAAAGDAALRLRELLVAGDPCPVCGATEHRATEIEALLGEQLKGQRARIAALEAEMVAATSEEVRLGSEIRSLTRQSETRDAEVARLEVRRGEQVYIREKALSSLRVSAEAAGFDAEDPLISSLLASELASIDAERRSMDAAVEECRVARSKESVARKLKDDTRTTFDLAGDVRREATARAAGVAASITRQRDAMDRLARFLDAAFVGPVDWRSLDDPVGWLAGRCAAWRRRTAEHAEASAAIPMLEGALAAARTDAAAAAALAEAIEEEASKLGSNMGSLADARRAMLDARSVLEVETELDAAASAQGRRLEESARSVVRTRLLLSTSKARREGAVASLAKAEENHRRLEASFADALRERSLDVDAVSAAAAGGAEVIELEEKWLSDIASAVRDAQTALLQRRSDLEIHDASEKPRIADDDLMDALGSARIAVADARAALDDALFVLRRDDEVRVETAGLRADLEREREASRVWLALSDLIGDKDGRTFRRFAQGLTLDRLLDHANERLRELKPRYALERGGGGDMLIQVVDYDMAGEVRGVHNLSGGERFLISLALALGLAEMSTGRGLRIESLFIDEGFGALDTSSLGQAIAVLEHLHATGRRVGVISHVEEVKERIPVKIEVVPVARGRSVLAISTN